MTKSAKYNRPKIMNFLRTSKNFLVKVTVILYENSPLSDLGMTGSGVLEKQPIVCSKTKGTLSETYTRKTDPNIGKFHR